MIGTGRAQSAGLSGAPCNILEWKAEDLSERAGPDPFTPVKRLADYAELFRRA
jgi:hypothetical protein